MYVLVYGTRDNVFVFYGATDINSPKYMCFHRRCCFINIRALILSQRIKLLREDLYRNKN